MEQLRDWLNQECDRRNLSWRQASIRAGIHSGAISAIMNGERPGLEVCKALAQSFNASPEYLLRLAGHLPPLPNPNDIPDEVRERADKLVDYWLKLRAIDPPSAERLMAIAELQAEMVLAATRSRDKARKEAAPHENTLTINS